MDNVYSLAAAASERKRIPWQQPQELRKVPIEIESVWVFAEDRDTCVVHAVKRSVTGRVKVCYTINSSGETAECSETFFRKNWCEREHFLNKVNKAMSRAVKLHAPPLPLQKGWQVWRENETGEYYTITETRCVKNRVIHTFLKGTTQGEISATALHEGYTFIHTV